VRRETPLILGAGPAGCAAAIALARAGAKPLVLEKTRETGDALCGGFLSWQSVKQLDFLGIDGLGAHPITQVRVMSGTQIAAASLPAPAIGLSRHRLDTVMQQVAQATGAILERGINVRSHADGILHAEGQDFAPDALFLATGKHEVRGLARPRPAGDAPLGLRIRIPSHPVLQRMLDHAIELHLFAGGYAGLLLQEDGSANLCMALRKSRLAEAGGDPARLLRQLGNAHPLLGERLAYLAADTPTDAIAAVPYGWRAATTVPGIFRLGDQAAVIPSLAGEGMGIAVASGIAAAAAFLDGGPDAAPKFQRDFAVRTRRPVAMAGFLWRQAEKPLATRLALPILNAFPALAVFAARVTRIGD
jgi:flavin-dependent dehydrogenase